METPSRNKIRILFTLPNLKTAGSGREMFNIVERLDKNIFEPWISVQKEGGSLYDEIIAKGYPVIIKPFIADQSKPISERLKHAKRYAAAFRPYQFQIWQSFNWSSDFTEALVARWAGARYVYVKKNMNWDRIAWKVKSLLSHAIVVRNTDLLQQHFSPWYYRRKSYFITGGVQLEQFRHAGAGTIRQQLGIPPDAFLATCIAQLVRVKDQLTLVKAVAKVDGIFAVLAGAARDETYLQEIKDLANRLGVAERVKVAGSVSDVVGLLNASDAFVLPTGKLFGHEEGCPVALLEAMAAGTPCIASDVAGSRDLIKNESTGLLFTPGDDEQLAKQLLRYKTDPLCAKQMADNAYANIKSRHTLQIETEAFANLYTRIAKRN